MTLALKPDPPPAGEAFVRAFIEAMQTMVWIGCVLLFIWFLTQAR